MDKHCDYLRRNAIDVNEYPSLKIAAKDVWGAYGERAGLTSGSLIDHFNSAHYSVAKDMIGYLHQAGNRYAYIIPDIGCS